MFKKGIQVSLVTNWKVVVNLSNWIHKKIDNRNVIKEVYKPIWWINFSFELGVNKTNIEPNKGTRMIYKRVDVFVKLSVKAIYKS